jgi:uncharacterized protein (DUF1697 family)
MPRFVALFRGINVGKAKRIAMADLRALLAKLGYRDVSTLLNSGNALFTAEDTATDQLATRIRGEVAKHLKVDALVVVKSAADIAAIVKGNALAELADDPSRLLVAVANDHSCIAALKKYSRQNWGTEQIHVNRHAAYLWCAQGILESKVVVALMGDLKDQGTTRNWATLSKLHASLSGTERTKGS